MSEVVVGYGEIGEAVASIIGDPAIDDFSLPTTKGTFNIMHICFPYSEEFIAFVEHYTKIYKAEHIVIWSTVPIGTTRQIKGAIHSPVEGKHPKLARSIKEMVRWIGANSKRDAKYFEDYFKQLKLKTQVVMNSDHTEALKLLSTTEYGLNIVFADYKAKIAKDIDMDYELTKRWNRDYNQLYRELGLDRTFQKFVLDAPNSKIGGHCIIPNTELLHELYPDEITYLIRRYK